MRVLWTFLALMALFCLPFFIWGQDFVRWFTIEGAVAWLRSWGAFGALAVIGLLMADLFLPIPATPVMSAAGYLYGAWIGGLISAVGSLATGLLGYGLCRALGRRVAAKLVGERALAEHESLFRRSGPWLVAASRWLPLLPEVISCMAGLTRMPLRVFATALACGSIPLGFTYAAIGAAGLNNPALAITLSVLVPPILWAVVSPAVHRRRDRDSGERSSSPRNR